MMNFILMLVVVCLWAKEAYRLKDTYLQLPSFKIVKKEKNKEVKERRFVTFKVIDTDKGLVFYDETKYRVI